VQCMGIDIEVQAESTIKASFSRKSAVARVLSQECCRKSACCFMKTYYNWADGKFFDLLRADEKLPEAYHSFINNFLNMKIFFNHRVSRFLVLEILVFCTAFCSANGGDPLLESMQSRLAELERTPKLNSAQVKLKSRLQVLKSKYSKSAPNLLARVMTIEQVGSALRVEFPNESIFIGPYLAVLNETKPQVQEKYDLAINLSQPLLPSSLKESAMSALKNANAALLLSTGTKPVLFARSLTNAQGYVVKGSDLLAKAKLLPLPKDSISWKYNGKTYTASSFVTGFNDSGVSFNAYAQTTEGSIIVSAVVLGEIKSGSNVPLNGSFQNNAVLSVCYGFPRQCVDKKSQSGYILIQGTSQKYVFGTFWFKTNPKDGVETTVSEGKFFIRAR